MSEEKFEIQVRTPAERRDTVDELAQTISEMASVSRVRQKEPLTQSLTGSQQTPTRVTPIRLPSR